MPLSWELSWHISCGDLRHVIKAADTDSARTPSCSTPGRQIPVFRKLLANQLDGTPKFCYLFPPRMWHRLIPIFHLLIVVCAWNSSTTARGVTFAWDPSPDPSVAGYGLYYSTQPFYNPHGTNDQGLSFTQSLLVGSDTAASLFGLSPNETYYLSVTAFDTNGVESDPSNLAVFNSSSPLPPRYSTN